MPAYRYDYDPDAQPQESMDARQDRKEVARTSRASNIRKMTEQVAAPARAMEQKLGIGRPVMRQMGEPAPMQRPAAQAAPPPPAPAKAPPMTADEAAALFLREARQQMDVLNAGRRNGSIDANLDKQMMGQINHLLNLHNEARASINSMPRQAQPAPAPVQAPAPAPAAAPASQPVKGAGMWQQPKAAPQAQPQAAPKPAPKAPAKQAQSKRPKMYRDYDPNERNYDMNRIGLPPEDLGPSYLHRTGRNAYTRNRRTEQG